MVIKRIILKMKPQKKTCGDPIYEMRVIVIIFIWPERQWKKLLYQENCRSFFRFSLYFSSFDLTIAFCCFPFIHNLTLPILLSDFFCLHYLSNFSNLIFYFPCKPNQAGLTGVQQTDEQTSILHISLLFNNLFAYFFTVR